MLQLMLQRVRTVHLAVPGRLRGMGFGWASGGADALPGTRLVHADEDDHA